MNPETEQQIAEIHEVIVRGASPGKLFAAAARRVVDARYYMGDDGWDVLKNAIGELEGLVGRTEEKP